jgi:2-O-methyltransferase
MRRAILYIKSTLKSALPPQLERPMNRLFHRVRGLTMIPLSHEEIAKLVEKPDPIILEIGCNDGSDTLAFLRAIPQAKIYCFEPDPRAIARFKKQLGSDHSNVKLFEIALSDQTGEINFHTSSGGDSPEGFDQSGSIRQPRNVLTRFTRITFEKTIRVRTCRLDDWCAENGVRQVDFIWMDVQGAEGDVITGAGEILKATKYLYTEYSNNELYDGQLSLKDLLKRLPLFDVVARYPGDVLLRNKELTSLTLTTYI